MRWHVRCSSNAPIVIQGVPGPNGELPVIDGQDAVTRLVLDYWNDPRGVIKVGGSSIPPAHTGYPAGHGAFVGRARFEAQA